MRELALHILDLIENSIRAGVSMICVTIEENRKEDSLKIAVEDNGTGLPVSPDVATDPFFTTKAGKRVGLGLSLFRAAAEQAGGGLTVGKSEYGGVSVVAKMGLSHIDRNPLGDLAATLSSVVCTNPHLDLWCRFCVDGREHTVKVSDVVKELKVGDCRGLTVARHFSEKIKAAISSLEVSA